MPHGGGHHGGGGGGHHHHGGGGGFGGGYHHHHHHHRNYGGAVYTGGYYGGYGRRHRGCIWGIVGVTIIVVVVVTISTSVTLSKDEDEENRFTGGDTRIKTFDTFFCSGIKVETNQDFHTDAHLYVIDKEPLLNVRSNLTFEDSFHLDEDTFHYWHYYLYKNSNITLDGCIHEGSGYWFYVIKGTSKWNDWKDYASTSKSVSHAYITASCDESNMAHKTFRVKDEDHYYIAYYNDQPSYVSGHQTLKVDRFEYNTPSTDKNLPNCMFAGPHTGTSCQVKVPMLSDNSKVLVRLPEVDDNKKEEDFDLYMDCIPRAGAYLIVICPPIALVVLVVIIVVVVFVYRSKLKKRRYQPIGGTTTTATVGSVFTPPPANNPTFDNEAPPPYKA